jgi:hypothetical protein
MRKTNAGIEKKERQQITPLEIAESTAMSQKFCVLFWQF